MLVGTVDGINYGFYLEDSKKKLKSYIEITDEEHTALIDGQAYGKRIVFHGTESKPTLEEPLPPTEKEIAEREIAELKTYLSETDYIAAKLAEGVATKEEYAEELTKRAEARERINELELSVA